MNAIAYIYLKNSVTSAKNMCSHRFYVAGRVKFEKLSERIVFLSDPNR